MAAQPSAPERFKANALSLCQLFEELQSQDPAFQGISFGLTIASAMIEEAKAESLINDFIERSHPYWEMIRLHDQAFFIERAPKLFVEVPAEYVSILTGLFAKGLVPEASLSEFWGILEGMVRIAIRYIHTERQPVIEGERVKYTRSFFPTVSVAKAKAVWGLTF